jgi:hypothetical protein
MLYRAVYSEHGETHCTACACSVNNKVASFAYTYIKVSFDSRLSVEYDGNMSRSTASKRSDRTVKMVCAPLCVCWSSANTQAHPSPHTPTPNHHVAKRPAVGIQAQ